MQRANDSFAFVRDFRTGQLLRKAPDLPPAGDRGVVIEVHGMHIAAFLHRAVRAPEAHWDNLAGFGVVAKPCGIRHADKLIVDRVARDLKRLRHHCSQFVRICAVGDDHELAVVELVRPLRISGVVERHRERPFANFCELHGLCLLVGDYVRPGTFRGATLLTPLRGEIEGEHRVVAPMLLHHST